MRQVFRNNGKTENRLVNEFSFREIGLILQKTENWARVTFMRDKCRLIRYLEEKENKSQGKENK